MNNPFKNDILSEEKIDKSIDILLNVKKKYKPPTEIINGVKYWNNSQGELHRVGGPAIISQDGSNWWYQNDKLHRMNGPAIIYSEKRKKYIKNMDIEVLLEDEYYLRGIQLSKQDYKLELETMLTKLKNDPDWK